jgi:hypothetical protein
MISGKSNTEKDQVELLWETLQNQAPNKEIKLELVIKSICEILRWPQKDLDKKLMLDSNEAFKMHNIFKELYLNKMAQNRTETVKEQYSFSPLLSNNTIIMAEKSRQKRQELVNHKRTHEDLCLEQNKKPSLADLLAVDKEDQVKRLSLAKMKKEEREAQECPFQPNAKKLSKSFSQMYNTCLYPRLGHLLAYQN